MHVPPRHSFEFINSSRFMHFIQFHVIHSLMCMHSSMSLIHVIASSGLLHGFQAEVNWYTGGNGYVTLPTAMAVKKPGVYLVKAKHIRWLDLSEEDQGPQTPSASITHLRWLGTRSQFVKMASERGREFGRKNMRSLRKC